MSTLANFVVAVETQDLALEAQERLIENGYDNILVRGAISTKAQRKRVPMMQF